MLRKTGNAYFAKGYETLLRIEPDLRAAEAQLSEPVEWLWDVVFMEALDSYFLFSSAWEDTYSASGFATFGSAVDAPPDVTGLSGDVVCAHGLFGNVRCP